MNRRHLLALISTALTALSGIANAGEFPSGSPKFHTDHAAAVAAAKKSGKPLVMVFSATWCGPCQLNKKQVYPSKEVQPYHGKFEWAYLDADDSANHPAMKKAGVTGIPHIEILSPAGENIGRSVGATSPAEFAKTLQAAAKRTAK